MATNTANPNQALIDLRQKYGLSYADIHKILNRDFQIILDPDSTKAYGPVPHKVSLSAVKRWFVNPESESFRKIPDIALAILDLSINNAK